MPQIRSGFRTALTRRAFCSLGMVVLAGCTDRQSPVGFMKETAPSRQLNYPLEPYPIMYAGVRDQRHRIPPVPYQRLRPDDLRQIVHDPTVQPPGSIVVDLSDHYLYFILKDRKAVRYAVALGPDLRLRAGPCRIHYRKAWPRWYRGTADLTRASHLGMSKKKGRAPGLHNPYGARAVFVTQGTVDTDFVLHGTSDWRALGGTVPLGSVALLNQDIIDLYSRVRDGAQVLVV